MKMAIVHDHLLEFGGAERVLVSLHKAFPDADIYTSYLNRDNLGVHGPELDGMNIHTSWADRVPGMKRLHSPLRFMYPLIWESMDFTGYDCVITSSATAMSRGIITRPDTLHVTYMHHPPRYLYNYETAMEWRKHVAIRIYATLINHGLRMWDYIAAQRPDFIISNSEETKKRVSKFYHRDSDVIYPPVTLATHRDKKVGEYYITVSRLARAKHIDVLIQAANTLGKQLIVVGGGRDESYLRSIAGPTVQFVGNVIESKLYELYEGAAAFLFASQDEEFGIAPVEAMSHGVPVIAYASGGLKETVKDGKNGFLYNELTATSAAMAIERYEGLSDHEKSEMSKHARKGSEQYGEEEFIKQVRNYVSKRAKDLRQS